MSDLKKKLRKFLDRDFREQIEKRDKLRKILAKMRKKQRELEAELAEEYDPAVQAELRKKLLLLSEQRRKGVGLLDELRDQRKRET